MLIRRITRERDLKRYAAETAHSWEDPSVPDIQWREGARPPMDDLAKGKYCNAFRAMRNLLTVARQAMPQEVYDVLDVGASTGYYHDVLARFDFPHRYTGCDISAAMREFATKKYPGITFDVQDARKMTYADASFDIVIEGCVLIGLVDWDKVVAECARVSKRLVIFHRTPLIPSPVDEWWESSAYGVQMLRTHLSRGRFEAACARAKLRQVAREEVDLTEGGAMLESSLWTKS